MEIKPSNSFNKLPQEGMGSATPSPRIPRLASLRMNTGIEIQNCAYRTGVKFGNTCIQNSRCAGTPAARAWLTKSAERSDAAVVHSTRAAVVQPSKPSSKKVTSTEIIGETFSGINARAVISKNSHGSDKKRSVTPIAILAQIPPRYPANPPIKAAIRVESSAAAGASSKEILVP